MFFSFGFGKKKRRTVRSTKKKGIKGKKPSAALLRACKRYRIKCTKKVGKRKVYRSVSLLKKLLRRKQKKSKQRKSLRSRRKVYRRRFRFGSVSTNAASTSAATNYGYNEPVARAPGVLSQSSQVVTAETNGNRPPGFNLEPSSLPIFGVYRPFFTEKVPTTVGPSWNFMRQKDGSSFPVGGPFVGYTSFGKKKRRTRSRRSRR